MKMWRPVGLKELEKIQASDMTAFPPRLPEQPIFYPVLSFEYAEKIARDWNSTRGDHDFVGVVLGFQVEGGFVARFEPQPAGGADHMELWIPAEQLAEFNQKIVGQIEVVARYENGERVA